MCKSNRLVVGMRHLNNCVVWGPHIYDYNKAVKMPLSQSTEYFKYRELEFNERINVPEASFISDRKTYQSAQQYGLGFITSGIFCQSFQHTVIFTPLTLLLVLSPPPPPACLQCYGQTYWGSVFSAAPIENTLKQIILFPCAGQNSELQAINFIDIMWKNVDDSWRMWKDWIFKVASTKCGRKIKDWNVVSFLQKSPMS